MSMANQELDLAVLDAVTQGFTKAGEILEYVSGRVRGDKNPFYRPVDRSLQRLRRARKIRFSTKSGWKLDGRSA